MAEVPHLKDKPNTVFVHMCNPQDFLESQALTHLGRNQALGVSS